jgi:hypothetical protein
VLTDAAIPLPGTAIDRVVIRKLQCSFLLLKLGLFTGMYFKGCYSCTKHVDLHLNYFKLLKPPNYSVSERALDVPLPLSLPWYQIAFFLVSSDLIATISRTNHCTLTCITGLQIERLSRITVTPAIAEAYRKYIAQTRLDHAG